jgi:hypothetical protein
MIQLDSDEDLRRNGPTPTPTPDTAITDSFPFLKLMDALGLSNAAARAFRQMCCGIERLPHRGGFNSAKSFRLSFGKCRRSGANR